MKKGSSSRRIFRIAIPLGVWFCLSLACARFEENQEVDKTETRITLPPQDQSRNGSLNPIDKPPQRLEDFLDSEDRITDPEAFTRLVLRDARKGNTKDLVRLGMSYYNGNNGLQPDEKKAMDLFERAGALGDGGGYLFIARMELNRSEMRPQSYELIRTNLKKSVDLQTPDAATQMYKLHVEGKHGFARDEKLAREWLEKSYRMGSQEGYALLADAHREGRLGYPKNPARAAELVLEGVDKGYEYLQGIAGKGFLHGVQGFSRDEKRGYDLLRQAAERGDMDADYELGALYEQGASVVQQDISKAIEHYQRANFRGSPDAAYRLAKIFSNGLFGVPRDQESGVRLLMRAARGRHPEAQFETAMFFLVHLPKNSPPHPNDLRFALDVLKDAADRGHTNACILFGAYLLNMLERSDQEPRDHELGLFYMTKALERDPGNAGLNLGRYFISRPGKTTQDVQKGIRYLELSASHGSVDAHQVLSEIYAVGLTGVKPNRNKVEHYRKKAAELTLQLRGAPDKSRPN